MIPVRATATAFVLLAALACRRAPAARASDEPEASGAEARATAGAAADSGALPANRFPAPDRPVSDIVSAQWSSEDSRDRAGEAETVTRLLGIGPGMQVADVGAGNGYYVIRLSPIVGSAGRVFAEDIVSEYVERLRTRVAREKLANVTVILGQSHDPALPRESVDIALLVHMYHEIEHPYALLYNLAPSLRPGARVAVLDMERQTSRHGTPITVLRCELSHAGYAADTVHTLGDGAYLAVFRAPVSRPTAAAIGERVRSAPCAQRAGAS